MTLKTTKIQNFIALSDVISLLNLTSGFGSILSTINNQLELAAILMIIAIMFDSCDGWVARKINRNDELKFGKNIDSLCDAVSFGAAPAIFLYTSASVQPFTTVASLIIVICGVLRLTRYNVIADHINTQDFIGFPIPGIAILLATYYLSGLYNSYIAVILAVFTSLLMISNAKYPKFDNKIILAVSAALIILIILPVSIEIYSINVPALLLLLFSLYYLLINLI